MTIKNNFKLFDDYSIEFTTDEAEFMKYFRDNRDKVFAENSVVNLEEILTEDEKIKIKVLSLNNDLQYKIRLYILKGRDRIGWFLGEQNNAETFYMRNTGLLEEHRNKGIYKKFLEVILEILKKKGFQKITSTHLATNNPVIVAKLKAGFMITGFEISDRFGLVVNLTLYYNEIRNKLMRYRTGEIKADEQLNKYLNLNKSK